MSGRSAAPTTADGRAEPGGDLGLGDSVRVVLNGEEIIGEVVDRGHDAREPVYYVRDRDGLLRAVRPEQTRHRIAPLADGGETA